MAPSLSELLSIAALLFVTASTLAHGQQYNCTSLADPPSTTPSSSRFRLLLSVGGSADSCHVLISGGSVAYYYVRVNNSLATAYSLLTLSSDFGPTGTLVASLSASNQTAYRAFATPSARLYARIASSILGVSDSVALDVELVSYNACPAGWFLSGGLCYGLPSVNNAIASYQNAIIGCQYVRANLAVDLSVPAMELNQVLRISGWSTAESQATSAWVGVADTASDGLYYLNGKVFAYSSSSNVKFPSSSSYTCTSWVDCRCAYLVNGVFYRQYCSQSMLYMCSCQPSGDNTRYSLATLDTLIQSKSYPIVINYYWVIGLGLGATCVLFGISLRVFCYRRAVANRRNMDSAAAAAAALSAGDDGYRRTPVPHAPYSAPAGSYPVQPAAQPPYPIYGNYAFYMPDGEGGGTVAIATSPTPPAYSQVGEDKPPTYEAATGGNGGN